MTADVTRDRRVTESGLGSSDSASVDGSRLFWALPSPVHERSGSGSQRPTGYKLMRSLPHAASRPSPGHHVSSLIVRQYVPIAIVAPAAPRRARRPSGPTPASPTLHAHYNGRAMP